MLSHRLSRPAAAFAIVGQIGATVTAQSALVGLAVAVIFVALIGPTFWSK